MVAYQLSAVALLAAGASAKFYHPRAAQVQDPNTIVQTVSSSIGGLFPTPSVVDPIFSGPAVGTSSSDNGGIYSILPIPTGSSISSGPVITTTSTVTVTESTSTSSSGSATESSGSSSSSSSSSSRPNTTGGANQPSGGSQQSTGGAAVHTAAPILGAAALALAYAL